MAVRHIDYPAPIPRPPGPKKEGVYLVTYAQNATPAHRGFLAALRVYCAERAASLVVIAGRYKNPTSVWSMSQRSEDTWDSILQPYLCRGRFSPSPNISVFGDISIQPTAERPLSKMEVFAGGGSGVFGHPRVQLLTVATATRMPRLLVTTGAITIPNYTDSRAGKTADGHHVMGATVIECDGAGAFHVRQITAREDGSFTDLDRDYSHSGASQAPPAAGLVCGDIHAGSVPGDVYKATFSGGTSVVQSVKPTTIVYHDVLDFDVRSHHTRHKMSDKVERAEGRAPNDVEKEVQGALAFIASATPDWAEPVVVASNHHDHFDRWLEESDPRSDPVNAEFYFRMWQQLLVARRGGSRAGAFELYASGRTSRARFLARDERLRIAGVDCGFHGDAGINGSRGSASQFARLGCSTVIGHSHSPCIVDDCYQVGVTGDLDQGYNTMPSSWLHTHCIIYADGNRTLVHVIDGKWRR